MSRTLKLTLVAVPIVVSLVVAIAYLPVSRWLADFVEWDRHLGVEGVVVYALIFVALGLALVPNTPLYIGAGLLYGTFWGGVMTTLLGVIIELGTVVMLRTSVRPWVEHKLARRDLLGALQRSVERDGFWILLLLRFSPLVPFGLLNYVLALMQVPMWKRVLTNILGMFPCCLMFAYLGTLLSGTARIATADPPPTWKYLAIIAGLATAIIAGLLAARATRAQRA
ncbi:MAG: TVP38/TMEM64 family protein [Kofleriaceae bacterium]|nr:TVP38/TMEM64 family protein [Kofleriaceae bacterium]